MVAARTLAEAPSHFVSICGEKRLRTGLRTDTGQRPMEEHIRRVAGGLKVGVRDTLRLLLHRCHHIFSSTSPSTSILQNITKWEPLWSLRHQYVTSSPCSKSTLILLKTSKYEPRKKEVYKKHVNYYSVTNQWLRNRLRNSWSQSVLTIVKGIWWTSKKISRAPSICSTNLCLLNSSRTCGI